jgi:sortase A
MIFLSRIERLLLICGLLLVTIFVAAHIDSAISSRAELKRFRDLQGELSEETSVGLSTDFNLWSNQRIAAYKKSVADPVDAPLGILRIPTVHLEVPVLDGTDELALNRGVGHIPSTVLPGQDGNIGIAGHRDGFFRVLKDVGPNAIIELESENRVDTYRVNQISIVTPHDVSVLQPRAIPSLTLVTCYPFYFIGSAPKRYIVEASRITSVRLDRVRMFTVQSANLGIGRSTRTRLESALQNSSLHSRKPVKEITQ